MSAMIESYDTQMVDYTADIDMQMHTSSSEPWLHDEVQMEEDGPASLKNDHFTHFKTNGHGQGDLTIEIDMEEHNSAEYDMVDDDEVHHSSAPDILDVDVYDASLGQSPAMAAFDTPLPVESAFTATAPPEESQQPLLVPILEPTIAPEMSTPAVAADSDTFSSLQEVAVAPPSLESYQDLAYAQSNPDSSTEVPAAPEPDTPAVTQEDAPQHFSNALPSDSHSGTYPIANEGTTEELIERGADEGQQGQANSEDHNGIVDEGQLAAPTLELSGQNDPEPSDSNDANAHAETASSGDPHEISEGVYIDPPPAVLLSLGSEELQFEHSFFNEPEDWRLSSAEQADAAHAPLLHHLPTLYYETLSSLFEALRQEEFIHSIFQSSDSELILEAVDLALTVSEDNIYAREVSLHDLNMLHDASGIAGPLRTRLYTTTPRFIARYHQLQEHVSRLQLEHSSRELSSVGQPHQGSQALLPVTTPAISSQEDRATLQDPEEITEPNVSAEGDDRQVNEATEIPLPSEVSHEEYQEQQDTDAEEVGQDTGETSTGQKEAKDVQEDDISAAHHPDSHFDQENESSHPDIDDSSESAAHSAVDDEAELSAHSEHHSGVINLHILENQPNEEQAYDEADSYEAHHAEEEEESPGIDETYVDNAQNTEEDFVAEGDAEGDEGFRQDEEARELEDQDAQTDEVSNQHSEYPEDNENHEGEADQENAVELETFSHHSGEVEQLADGDGEPIDNSLGEAYTGDQIEDEAIPELPAEPISFDDENWDDTFEDGGNADITWNEEDDNENAQSASNNSSVTLSSRTSKRTFDEYESGGEGLEEVDGQWDAPSSPDPKRSRTE